MRRIDWVLSERDGHSVLTRYETPIDLWLLDRWFRIPDLVFDRIEWWLPWTSPVTRIPCVLYSRWFAWLVGWRDFTDYTVRLSSSTTNLGD